MQRRHNPPANSSDFEDFCARLLRRHWQCDNVQLYGRGGQLQCGVDILDLSGGDKVRAAQCKCYDHMSELAAAVFLPDVEAAKNFKPALNEYWILTTARRSTSTQHTIAELNRAHKQQGLFEVVFLAWEDICLILDRYPGIEFDPGEVAAASSALSAANAQPAQPLPASINPDALDSEIDEAAQIMERGDRALGEMLLNRIRARKWDQLNLRQRYRVLANIGLANLAGDRTPDGARLLIEAKQYQPDDERACADEAMGYALVGEVEKSRELAEAAHARFPLSARVSQAWLNTCNPNIRIEDLLLRLDPAVRGVVPVLLAAADRALAGGRANLAVEYSTRAAEADPNSAYAWFMRSNARLVQLSWAMPDPNEPSDVNSEELKCAQDEATRAIELAQAQKLTRLNALALGVRSEVRNLLGEVKDRDEDLELASQLAPRDPDILRERGRAALLAHRVPDGIKLLRRSLENGAGAESKFLLGAALLKPGDGYLPREAVALLSEAASAPSFLPEGARFDAAAMAVRALADFGEINGASALLDSVRTPCLGDLERATLRAGLALHCKDPVAANAALDAALAVGPAPAAISVNRALAETLEGAGRDKDALGVWQRIARAGKLTNDTRRLIDCASRLDRDDLVMEWCKGLREAGVDDPVLMQVEMSRLQRYDPEKGVVVLQEYVPRHPDDRLARLLLSSLGFQLHRPDLITSDPSLLPRPSEVEPQNWRLLAAAIRRGPDPLTGVQFAYDMLRSHYGMRESHEAFLESMSPAEGGVNLPAPLIAGAGVAVEFAESGRPDTWVVIEDSEPIRLELEEIGVSDYLAKQLDGKKVGETFQISEYRAATVKSLLSKFVFRYQQVLNDWETKFSGDGRVRRIPMITDASGKVDFSSILRLLGEQEQKRRKLEDIFRQGSMPIAMFASAQGKNAFATQIYIARAESLQIGCCIGTAEERNLAIQAYRSASRVVVDLTALTTWFLVESKTLGVPLPRNAVVPRAAIEEIEAYLRAQHDGGAGKRIGTGGGQLFIHETSPDDAMAWHARISEFLGTVRANCAIDDGQTLAAMDPAKRESACKVFGEHGAAAIVLAIQPGSVLWTDDLVLARIARTEHGIDSIWTQALLQALAEDGKIPGDGYFEASASLFGFRYHFISANAGVILHAGRLAQWHPGAAPLREVLEQFADVGIESGPVLQLAVGLLRTTYSELALSTSRETVVRGLLASLGRRPNGRREIERLLKFIPIVFALVPGRATETAEIVKAWLDQNPPETLVTIR